MPLTITEQDVLRALGTVMDPELGRDLVSLGMVQDVVIEGSRVQFTLVLTTPACPLRGQIQEAARTAVQALPGVGEVAVNVTARVAGRRATGKAPIPGVAHIIAVASGKGGVGKSTVSANLAVGLAQTGARVGLLDADITGPNLPLMMGVDGQPQAVDGKLQPLASHGVKLMSIGFFVNEGTPVVWRGPLIAGAIQQFLRDVDWGELDYLVIDLPPGTGDAPLSLAQMAPLTGVIIVSTPQDVALQDAIRSIALFQKLEVPILGLVENMSYFVCPCCSQRTEIFGSGGAERTAERLGVPLLGRIPLDPAVRIGGDEGRPVVVGAHTSVQAQAFQDLAGAVAARVSVLEHRPIGADEKAASAAS